MWKVMVVEDEAIVRLGLKAMNFWETNDIQYAAEASNGVEALGLFDQHNVDIVLTDIRMPRMDGIQLAKQLKERNPHIQIIFFTSFDDFAYVKEALQLGAVDFLHKPTMDENEIVQALRKAIHNLAGIQERIEPQREKAVQLLTERDRNDFLLTMLDTYTFPESWERSWGHFSLPSFSSGYYLVSFRIIEVTDFKESVMQLEQSIFHSVHHFIEKYVSHDWRTVVFTRDNREIIWICPEAVEQQLSLERYIDCLTGKIRNLLQVSLSFTFSKPHSTLVQLPSAYMEALLQYPISEELSPTIRLAKEYINDHYCRDINLSNVAQEIRVSVGYLSRLFLKEMGEHFTDYLTNKRIKKAKELLRGTSMKIYEISERIGYKNSHYFSRLFKGVVGMTPLEFRNVRKNQKK